ncbi:MAG: triphosphoribosyl-dephospho-CoA synthase [Candidatus Izemoplasmatales bacterium]
MNIKDKILYGREERANIISSLLKKYDTVISIKANMPGEDKNSYLSYLLINAFSFLVKYYQNSFCNYLQNEDGPFLIIGINGCESKKVKEEMIDIEENHDLGRFIDIDVYDKFNILTRNELRKCYLCDDYAFHCMKTRKHSENEIWNYISEKVYNYYKEILLQIIDDSMMEELNLHPKFGLVTSRSSGSHKDMDYELMIKAKDAILPYFIDMFILSCRNSDKKILVSELKKIGISAETSMLSVTNGINAYKGLIFNLGIIISSFGYKISRYVDENEFAIAKEFSEILFSDLDYSSNSIGDKAFREYGFLGVKGEAMSGYANVNKALGLLTDLSFDSKMMTLQYFIINIQDTSFLKRAKSLEFYNDVVNLFLGLDIKNKKQIYELTDFCIINNLSFGGSADLLVVTIFIKKISDFCISFKKDNN